MPDLNVILCLDVDYRAGGTPVALLGLLRYELSAELPLEVPNIAVYIRGEMSEEEAEFLSEMRVELSTPDGRVIAAGSALQVAPPHLREGRCIETIANLKDLILRDEGAHKVDIYWADDRVKQVRFLVRRKS